jgi:hypothetical protein
MNDTPRQNKYLNEILDHYDAIHERANHNNDRAVDMLTSDDQAWLDQEINRCMTTPRYYMENYHVIRTEQEGFKTLFPFWESQEIFYNEIRQFQERDKPVRILCLKARQQGLTTISQGLVVWKTIFTEACNSLDVAQDIDQSAYMFEMSRLAIDSLPWWMRPEIRYAEKGKNINFDRKDDHLRQVKPGLKSNIFVEAANKPTGVARGKTLRCLHASELSSWPDGGQLTKSIFPTMNATDTLAIMESTALGRVGFFYEFWKKTMDGKTAWHPTFIEFFRVTKYSIPITAGKVFHRTKDEEVFAHRVLEDKGVIISDETLNWMRMKKEEFIATDGDEFSFYGEYPSNWQEAFQGTGICAFDKRKLQRMMEAAVKPLWVGEIIWDQTTHTLQERIEPHDPHASLKNPEVNGDKRWRVWEQYDHERDYYVSADVAMGAQGGDFSCVMVMKIGRGMEPHEQVAEWRGWVHPTRFAYIIYAICHKYGMPEVAVEVNNMGIQTNSTLMSELQYDNLYRWKHVDKIKNQMTDYVGWYTTAKSRDNALSKLVEAVSDQTIIVRSEWTIDEMLDFSDGDSGGRFEGQDTNDDRVMALMICNYCAGESEFGKQAASQPMSSGRATAKFVVMDSLSRRRAEFDDKQSAIKMVGENHGWSWVQLPSHRDYANTAYSPVHDGDGLASRMHYEMGYSPEQINSETMAYEAAMEVEPSADDPDAWMSF